jgi:sugar O-acyltransferase (sialic acid O-acetyltransferase NeuD family)
VTTEELVLIGGGGHCKACIDVIEAANKFRIAGIVDMKEKKGTSVLGYNIFAVDEDLPALVSEYRNFFIAVGQTGSSHRRQHLFTVLKRLKACLPAIISPFSYISKYAEVGEGTIIMNGTLINAGVRIGKNCIINTAAVIEHDSVIGDHCHISTGSVINGECSVGEGALVGSNSVISNNLSIAKETIIGAGSVVIRSIEDSGTYAGVPVRKIK